jgi:purine nucleosidase
LNHRASRRALATARALLAAAAVALGMSDAAAAALWIDTDPSCHRDGWHDVDDCLALHRLLSDPAVAVRGISTVAGNTSLAATFAELQQILRMVGRADRPGQRPWLVAADGAAAALIASLQREPLTVLALGPLTNVAAALKARPDLAARIVTIVFVGGSRPGQALRLPDQRWTHFHDRNVTADAAAISQVLRARVPLVLIPFEGMTHLRLSADGLHAAMVLPAALLEATRRWQVLWRDRLGLDGFVPFDLVAATWLIAPEVFACDDVRVKVHDPTHAVTTLRRALHFEPGTNGHALRRCAPLDPQRWRAALAP